MKRVDAKTKAELDALLAELQAEDEAEEEPTQPSVVRPCASALTGYAAGGDLVLMQQNAQQQADLTVAREKLESLESQRRWLMGGLGVSVGVFLLLAFRKRRTPPAGGPQPYPGQLAGRRTVA